MNRVIAGLVGVLMVGMALLPSGVSKALDPAGYEVIGVDPLGDGVLPLASGVNWPACGTGFGCTKYDVVQLETASDEETIHLKLRPGASYIGTGGLIYAVHFEAGGKKFFTCWAIHSVGTTAAWGPRESELENTVGCSRFTGETQVGPATRALGVEDSTVAGNLYVDWPVPKTAIGGGTDLTNIVAEIWARGPSTSNAGSTTQAHYLWNRGDRAPDTGGWAYTLGPKAAALNLTLTAETDETSAAPGETALYNLTLGAIGNGTTNVTLNVSGLPDAWSGAFTPANVSATGGNSTNFTLEVAVPAEAENQTLALVVNANAEGNITTALNLTLMIRPSPTPASPNATTNATSTDAAGAPKGADSKGVPALGLVGILAAIGTIVAARRRRPI